MKKCVIELPYQEFLDNHKSKSLYVAVRIFDTQNE